MTQLKGGFASELGVPLALSIVPPSMLEPAYGIPLVLSMDPIIVPTYAYSTLHTPSMVIPLVPIFEYGVSRSIVQPSSMISSYMGSHSAKFNMPLIITSVAMSYKDYKRFDRLTYLVLHRFSGFVGKDAYDFLMDYHKKLHNLGLLESYGVSYTTFQLVDIVRNWQRSYI